MRLFLSLLFVVAVRGGGSSSVAVVVIVDVVVEGAGIAAQGSEDFLLVGRCIITYSYNRMIYQLKPHRPRLCRFGA